MSEELGVTSVPVGKIGALYPTIRPTRLEARRDRKVLERSPGTRVESSIR